MMETQGPIKADSGGPSGFTNIIYEKKDGVAVITLNRPHRLNALSRATYSELFEALADVERDDDVRVLVLTGAPRADGRPCFSAGGDLKEIAEKGLEALGFKGSSILDDVEGMVRLGRVGGVGALKKPTIAAIDGICTAGGIELAESFDIRIVSETAQISDMHIKNLGTIGGGGNTVGLQRLVGAAKAKELIFTGDVIDGKEAWRIGFANQVVPPEKLMEYTMELARKIASMDPMGIRTAKASIDASVDMDLRHAMAYSRICFAAYSPTDGAKRFAARRGEEATSQGEKER